MDKEERKDEQILRNIEEIHILPGDNEEYSIIRKEVFKQLTKSRTG